MTLAVPPGRRWSCSSGLWMAVRPTRRARHVAAASRCGWLLIAAAAVLLLPRPARAEPVPEIRVPEGFVVERVAGSPLVEHPMMACLDDRGRLFIAESAGLNLRTQELEQQLPNFIRLLEDTDGDGRFDKSTIFADKMTLPQGALWHQGALYVASPPNIWKLEDTDNDGVADRRQVLVGQFGYTGNAASVHGCFLGPDGRIYWCDGRHGHEFRDPDGRLVGRGDGSYIFSCNPDGSDVRAHCGGGMDNPVEVDFTDSGDVLGTVNILYTGPRIDCLVHWLHGGTYPHSQRVLGEFKRTGELLGPVHKFGHVAVSGTARYRSGALDRTWRDDWFVTIFNTGKLQRVTLRPSGSTFQATEHDFLQCDSGDFHPTDVLEDADGSLLLIDTGGWFRIGCPTSQIAKQEVKGGIYRIRRRGMAPIPDPWGLRIDWAELTGGQLVGLLNDARYKVRERAIVECAARGEALVPALAAALDRQDVRHRLGAVWALTRIRTPASQAAVRRALGDREAVVRQAACVSVATTRDAAALSPLLEILDIDLPAVRRAAAQALGRIGDSRAVLNLLQSLPAVADREEEHAVLYALIEIGDPQATAVGLTFQPAAVRRGALIALQQMDAKLEPSAVFSLLESADTKSAEAALEVLVLHPEWAEQAAAMVGRWLRDPECPVGRQAIARRLLAALLPQPPVGSLVGRLLDDPQAPEAARRVALGAIADADAPELNAGWKDPLDQLLATGDGPLLEAAMTAAGRIKTDHFDVVLRRIAGDPRRPAAVRLVALESLSLAGRGVELSDEAFDLLVGLLADRTAPVQASRSARLLGQARLTAAQLQRLAPHLRSAGPLELRSLIQPFRHSQQAGVAAELLASVSRSPGFFSLTAEELSEVVQGYPAELLAESNSLLERLRAKDQQKQQRLDELAPYLAGGDATRGRALFGSEKTRCATCHRVDGQGGMIGPDLSGIGRIRNERDLLEAIVFPSASLAREYEPYQVVTAAGQVLSGLVVRETPQALHLQQQTGPPVVLLRDEIEQIAPGTVSLMPEGLDRTVPPESLADLIAYLKTLRGAAPAAAGGD